MTLTALNKAPFPWFGGKRYAAPLVWSLLGDTPHYVEPFFGTGAVLLERPHPCNRPYFSETVNDADGLLCNFWRAVQRFPVETAEAASWPVVEADKSARQIALLRWRDERVVDLLAGSADWCDPVMAGWWAWAVCVQIGAFDGRGPWTADPVTGRIVKQARGPVREPGVLHDLPHLSNNGQGVNHASTREPGVSRDRPHLSDDGRGVNRPGTRVPGVSRDLPHLTNNGQGVNHASTREPGVTVPPGDEFHPVTMPELIRWFRFLSARLRHVRVLNGDWTRVVTTGAAHHLPVRQGKGPCGVFLDPPYADTAIRDDNLYHHDSLDVAHDVREWALRNGDDPLFRIVLAGFEGEHGTVLTGAGWTEHEWFTSGHLRGGMGNVNAADGHQQNRERLWASPHCLTARDDQQLGLFGPAEGGWS